MKKQITIAVASAAVLAVAAAAMAQGPPQIRDSRTGKLWTPDVEVDYQATAPDAPVNRAFDPRDQSAVVQGTVLQRPRAQLMGTVPMLAGPSVPVVSLDLPTLQALPGKHWLTILYVTNNSTRTVDIVVGCQFTNGGRMVENTQVIIPPAGPGERLGVPIRGPQTDLFVDQVRCNVMSPV
jgi:hypothetical protein